MAKVNFLADFIRNKSFGKCNKNKNIYRYRTNCTYIIISNKNSFCYIQTPILQYKYPNCARKNLYKILKRKLR